MVTPPGIERRLTQLLVAAKKLGRRNLSGRRAQAIAALAYGTETIPKVNVITGPGNIYVTLAKKLVYGTVGIDSLAGLRGAADIADETANPFIWQLTCWRKLNTIRWRQHFVDDGYWFG